MGDGSTDGVIVGEIVMLGTLGSDALICLLLLVSPLFLLY